MPDGLVEVAARAIVEIGARVTLKYFLYPIGWVIIKSITLGKYPSSNKPHNRDLISTIGLAVILAVITFKYS